MFCVSSYADFFPQKASGRARFPAVQNNEEKKSALDLVDFYLLFGSENFLLNMQVLELGVLFRVFRSILVVRRELFCCMVNNCFKVNRQYLYFWF